MNSERHFRICHIVSHSADSEYMRNLGVGLSRKGVSQFWVTLFDSGKDAPDWAKRTENTDYLCLDVKSRHGFPAAVIRLAFQLKRRRIELVQTHLYEASLVGLIAAMLARTPVKVLTRHHLDQALLIGKSLPILVDRWEAKTADYIVTLGAAVEQHLIRREGVDPAKINVVYQGFDFDRFTATNEERKAIREEFGVGDDEVLVGSFGNFFPTKGHRFLLEAISKLTVSFPKIRLFFVGDGGGKTEVLHRAVELGLGDKVIFTGFRNDVPACMKACDLVVHPSLSEAFCQVLIESMSVGTPLICTDVGGAREVIQDGVTGCLVPAADSDALAKKVSEFLGDRKKAARMAAKGQAFVREKFTVERMINQQYRLYSKWLSSD